MNKDNTIYEKVVELYGITKEWLDYLADFSPCAYSDRGLEEIIGLSKEIEKIYNE